MVAVTHALALALARMGTRAARKKKMPIAARSDRIEVTRYDRLAKFTNARIAVVHGGGKSEERRTS